ncbi:MAG TPA: hypothetical protein VMB26_15185 [Candidatus Binataceae bacterium]|nr:hypothetical protein [Candidatus Binataceae bacterium]
MSRSKVFLSLAALVCFCAMAGSSFAKPAPTPKCGFNGNYSFFFWDPDTDLAGVGYFSVAMNNKTQCRSGVVLPGGIINCNFDSGVIYEDFVEDGAVFLETDGEGTMELETNSSRGICGTGKNALELDISVVLGGKTVLFGSNGVEKISSGTVPNAGYNYTLTGRADRCFAGQISGCYDIRLWEPDDSVVGDCSICVNGAGAVTGGTCRCNSDGFEYLSEIEAGAYTLGENCQSSTGYLWFVTSSDEICGAESFLALDFAVAQQGKELIGACDTSEYILDNRSEPNAGYEVNCAFEGWLQ